jgi:ADP-heptose:LPS heptosyltransferase
MQGMRLYLGNDTGTMHLAVAAGLRCVAVFSARDWPGKWDPYGSGHHVLRVDVSCAGCKLVTCDRQMECLTGIEPSKAIVACEDLLAGQRA